MYPPKRTLLDLVQQSLQSQDQAGALLAAALPLDERRALGVALAPMRLFHAGELLTLMPSSFSR